VLREFGPPEVLVAAEVPDLAPGPGQALIDVEIANITFVDTQVRAGNAPNPAMAPQPPAILGNGVGSLLVQLARNAGARVVAAAGGRRKLSLAGELGASVAVDYTEPGWTDRVRAQLDGIDVVFDGVGGAIGRAAFDLLRDGGRFCAFGMASGAFVEIPDGEAARRNLAVIRGAHVTPEQMRELTRAALAEAAAGRLRPVIGQTFPLERAADAHAAIEGRATVGKSLLLVGAKAGGPR
jgi:NADPH2:quinone reductase